MLATTPRRRDVDEPTEPTPALADVPPPAPTLPTPRGPISGWLIETLGSSSPDRNGRAAPSFEIGIVDSITDEDLQLALYVIYELSYRGFDDVEDRFEWDAEILGLRRRLENQFEADLRRQVSASRLADGAHSVSEVLARAQGPSLSEHLARDGTRTEFEEFCIHRAAYQLKEADPHSWALPRLSGPRKAALVEIQTDEYGHGRTGDAHADVYADLLVALGLDPRYGAYIDRVPAITLSTSNLASLLGLHRRLLPALLGHLAAFEMTSVGPLTRYRVAVDRLGLGDVVGRFYDLHIEADEHHGELASTQLVAHGPDLDSDGVCFGAAALTVIEDRFTRYLLHAWARGESSLR